MAQERRFIMSKIQLRCFPGFFEIERVSSEGDGLITFCFDKALDGYIAIGDTVKEIVGREVKIDTRRLDDGEYTPRYIYEGGERNLPKIRKQNGVTYPLPYTDEDIRKLSIKAGEISRDLDEIKGEIDKITKKVFGTTIF